MRVRYDNQIFVQQRHGGISRYFVELIRAFQQNAGLGVEPELGWRWTRNAHALEADLGRPLPLLGAKGVTLRWANRLAHRSQPSADLLHATYYHPRDMPRGAERPLVVTIYDMTPELFPQLFAAGNPHMAKRDYVARASLILCISESTRSDLTAVYGDIEAPVVVTPLGVGPEFGPAAPKPPWCPPRYVLFVGRRDGYKDFDVALESFAEMAPDQAGLTLLAVGGGAFNEVEEALIARSRLRGSVIQRAASEAELPGVFAGAEAFVFPSRYEGFGLPTLEAMASGTPTVLADSSSHPEAGGDAALYFPPGDASVLASQLARILADSDLSRNLAERGISRAALFSWARTAGETAAAYRTVSAHASS